MKKLIYILFILFAAITAVTIYKATSSYDGLVESHYYERARDFFKDRERDETMGLEVSVPDQVAAGKGPFSAEVSLGGNPLDGADVSLFVGGASSTEHDTTYSLKETVPGRYSGEIDIPFKGRWLMRLEIRSSYINTDRRWFAEAR